MQIPLNSSAPDMTDGSVFQGVIRCVCSHFHESFIAASHAIKAKVIPGTCSSRGWNSRQRPSSRNLCIKYDPGMGRQPRLIQSLNNGSGMNKAYVHGYDPREGRRLQDQASTLVELLHSDTTYPAGSRVLEAGCGVGAQTLTLSRNSPGASITSLDISRASVLQAGERLRRQALRILIFWRRMYFIFPSIPNPSTTSSSALSSSTSPGRWRL